MPQGTKKFHNQSTHTYTWFVLVSEHLSKKFAKISAARERDQGSDARVVPIGNERYGVYVHRNPRRKEYY